MKYSLSFIVFLLLSYSVSAQKGLRIEKELIEVSFNSTMTIEDLVSIRAQLQEKDIELHYVHAYFYDNGDLSSISFKVDCKDGFSGSANQKYLKRKSRFGFRRAYGKDVRSPFGTGNLKGM